MPTLTAPAAPGSLTSPVEPAAFLRYLQALGEWIRARRAELDSLDTVAQQRHADEVTGDIMLSMALWQTCQERYELLLATWDSGRVAGPQLEQLATLLWGRIDAGASTPGSPNGALSLPEACRLSDALVGQLRTRLQLDPDADQITARLGIVRATIERLRDQIGLEPDDARPAAAAQVDDFARRASAISQKAARGGDVGGLLGPLELETAEYERDLIVGGAKRRQARAAQVQLGERLADLTARADALRQLVAQTVAAVVEAPNYAVPAVAALGPVPADDAEAEAYAARLDQVSRALQVVQQAYSQALARRDAVARQADAVFAVIDSAAHADPDLRALREATGRLLERRPTALAVVEPLVQALSAATGGKEERR